MKAETTAGLREPLTRFDVFLSYNSADPTSVERLARHLTRVGLQPWFDRWSLTPGGRWQEEIDAGLNESASCAVIIGEHDVGDWERLELSVALIKAACRVPEKGASQASASCIATRRKWRRS